MKNWLLLIFLLTCGKLMGQCPVTNAVLNGGQCTIDTLRLEASSLGPISSIVWYNGSQAVKTVTGTLSAAPMMVVAGGNGSGGAANQLYGPTQICVDGSENLYIADDDNNRVQEFPPGSTSATNGNTIISNVIPSGTAVGYGLTGVYLDGQGNIYEEGLYNSGNNVVVEKWAPGAGSGVQVASLTPTIVGTSVTFVPGKIFVDGADNVYVVEPGNNRIQKWAPGATSGVTVAGGNGPGFGASQLNDPQGVFVDGSGNIYAVDFANNRIQEWAPGATSGVTVAGGDSQGSASNQLNGPMGICVDGSGNMYIADAANNRIQLWTPGAIGGITVAGGIGPGSALNQLSYPNDIFLDGQGDFYICDHDNERILKTRPILNTTDTTLITDQPGVYTAVVTTSAGCTYTTNEITVQQMIDVGVSLNTAPNSICAGNPVTLTAAVNATGLTFSYSWLVNSDPATGSGAIYTDEQPSNGDIVICTATTQTACVSVMSDTVTLKVNPVPVIQPGQEFWFAEGGSVKLDPVVSGSVDSWTWSPATDLSNSTVADPIADPQTNTVYTLQVVSPEGCADTATIMVGVNKPVGIPGSFTPNGDGKNDIFYVMGGSPGTMVNMTIFNRWGQKIFQAQDVPPGDASAGWNGQLNGQYVPVGTYVYIISVRMPGESEQTFHGTVEVMR